MYNRAIDNDDYSDVGCVDVFGSYLNMSMPQQRSQSQTFSQPWIPLGTAFAQGTVRSEDA